MGKQLVLVGGGHAHMVTLANVHKFVAKGFSVKVIAPSEHHYYSGMGPGLLSRIYAPEDIRFATRHVVEKQGGVFIPGKAVRVDPDDKTVFLESGQTVSYDVLSCNVGSYVPLSIVKGDGADIYPVKPIEKLVAAQARILALASQRKMIIGIVGGGPSAAEIAGNAWRLSRDFGKHEPVIQVFCAGTFMSNFSKNVGRKVADSLLKRGIEILEHSHVTRTQPGKITTKTGRQYRADIIFLALGIKPSPIFKTSGLPVGPDGGLLVNKCLQSVEYPEIFGGGDCIYFKERPLDKVGVYAVRQNPVLCHNLMAALEKTALQSFNPGKDYLLIFNMGDGTGVLRKKWLLFGGRGAFLIKDYIDRKFMKKYQSIEE